MMTAPDMLEAPATVAHRSCEGPRHDHGAPCEPPGSGTITGPATPRSMASLGSFVLQDPGPPKTPPSTAPPTSMSSLRAPSEPPSHSSNPLPDCMRVQARLAGVQPLPDPLHAILPAGGKGRREASRVILRSGWAVDRNFKTSWPGVPGRAPRENLSVFKAYLNDFQAKLDDQKKVGNVSMRRSESSANRCIPERVTEQTGSL